MKLEFYKPKNQILKKYIEGFYFLTQDKISNQIKYLTFPNNYCVLSVNQHAVVELKQRQILISSCEDQYIMADFVSRYSEPIEVIYQGFINEITIYFKPLGANHFMDSVKIFNLPIMTDFNPFDDFKPKMEIIFNEGMRERQLELLEIYWLSKYDKQDLYQMQQILIDVESDLKIAQVAAKHQVSRKHITTMFLRHVGKTPSEYRKIHRFRNTLLNYKNSKNLTTLSYGNFFYDQSHFIKDFKALTHLHPSVFFKQVDTEKENMWFFI
ncbi:helix-turn-helix domain-containing protein [Sphingobacterium faecium]|uniref:helix-turn-helix domain-containing protein n=1 Tax=Sphingobacterium faecium TaxID=34087 RepID=UPI003DA45F99